MFLWNLLHYTAYHDNITYSYKYATDFVNVGITFQIKVFWVLTLCSVGIPPQHYNSVTTKKTSTCTGINY